MPDVSTTQGQVDPAPPAADDKPTPWWRRRFVAPAILLGLGGALAAGAGLAYPSPDTGIAIPAPPALGIYTVIPVRHLEYSVTQVSPQVTELAVVVSGGFENAARKPAAAAAPSPASNGTLTITLPPGLAFQDNQAGCTEPSGVNPASCTVTLAFGIEGAERTFLVSAPHFGVNYDGVFAYAAIPEVRYSLFVSGSAAALVPLEAPTYQVSYDIPSAGSYDWSSFPPTISGSSTTWQQLLGMGDTQARTAPGVNHTAESDAANWTFWAGILAGFAGGALLAAIQVLLPTGDSSRS